MPSFSQISKDRLATCDPRLQFLFNEVIKAIDCAVICGTRNEEDQNKAFHDGFSKLQWPNGRHNHLPSLAVDVMRCPIDWNDIEGQKAFGIYVKECASKLSIELEWGGDWIGFPDRDHFQVKATTA